MLRSWEGVSPSLEPSLKLSTATFLPDTATKTSRCFCRVASEVPVVRHAFARNTETDLDVDPEAHREIAAEVREPSLVATEHLEPAAPEAAAFLEGVADLGVVVACGNVFAVVPGEPRGQRGHLQTPQRTAIDGSACHPLQCMGSNSGPSLTPLHCPPPTDAAHHRRKPRPVALSLSCVRSPPLCPCHHQAYVGPTHPPLSKRLRSVFHW